MIFPTLLLFVHITLIVFAFGILVFPGWLAEAVTKTRDVKAIRAVTSRTLRWSKIGGPMVMLAGIFGLLTAIYEGLPLLSSWLVVTYVLFVILVVIGIGVYARWHAQVYSAAMASPDEAPSPELNAVLDRGIPVTIHAFDHALWVALLVVMVFKPHFW